MMRPAPGEVMVFCAKPDETRVVRLRSAPLVGLALVTVRRYSSFVLPLM